MLLKSNWERASRDTVHIPEAGGGRGGDREIRVVSGEEVLKGFERAVSRRALCFPSLNVGYFFAVCAVCFFGLERSRDGGLLTKSRTRVLSRRPREISLPLRLEHRALPHD